MQPVMDFLRTAISAINRRAAFAVFLAGGSAMVSLPSSFAAELTWLGGNGSWANGQASNWAGGVAWQNDDSAVFHSTPGTVTLGSSFMDVRNISIADGYTFTGGLVSMTVRSLRFVTPGSGTGLTLRNQVQLSVTEANGIIGGNFHLMDSVYLTAEIANAITGGRINLSGNSILEATAANSTTKNVNVHFDTSLGGTGGHLQLNGISTTVGQLVSAGPAAAGIIENISSTAAHLTSDFDTAITTFNGSIRDGAGSLSFTKAGTGTLILANDLNTYTGGTTLKGGILAVRHDSSLGHSGTSVTFDGGTLQANASVTMIHAFNVAAGGGVVNTNGFDMVMFTLGGSGNLTKRGTGNITLIGDDSYFSGHLSIEDGAVDIIAGKTLHLGTGGTSGSLTGENLRNYGTVVFNRSDSYDFFSPITGSGNIRKEGTGTLTLSGTNTSTGGVVINSGTLRLGSTTALGTQGQIHFGGTGVLQYSSSNTSDYSGRIDLADGQHYRIDTNGQYVEWAADMNTWSALEKLGSGTLNLVHEKVFRGGVTLTGGVLAVDNGVLVGSGSILFNGGTLHFNPSLTPMADLSYIFSTAANQVFSVSNEHYGDVYLGANLTSAGGSLIKSGNGRIQLSGNNTYDKGTTIQEGTLEIFSDANIGAGGVTLDGGTLNIANSGTLSASRNYTVTSRGGSILGGTVFMHTLTGTSGGDLGGNTNLHLSNSTHFIGGLSANSLTMGSGASLEIGNGTVGSLHVEHGLTLNSGTVTLNTSQASTVRGLAGAGTLTIKGSGVSQFLGISTFSGTTHLDGGVVEIDQGLAFGSSAVFMNSGTIRTVSAVSLENSLHLASGGGTIDTGGYNSTLNTFDGSGPLHKTGLGQLTLVGATNIFTGDLSINQGIFRVFDTATLQIGNGGMTGTLSGNILNNGHFIFNRSGQSSYGGVMSGAGTLQFLGTGVITISGANTHEGLTTIQNFAVIVSGTGRLGQNSLVQNDSHLIFSLDDGQTMANVISGTGRVSYDGSGVTLVTGSNSYTGGTELNTGVLKLGSAGALGSSGTIFMNGGTMAFSAANTTDYSGRFTNAEAQQFNFDTAGQDVYFGHDLNYAGAGTTTLTKLGAGTLTMGRAATYNGVTTIHEGTLRLAYDGGLRSVNLTGNNATLDIAFPYGSIGHLTGVVNTTISGNRMNIDEGSFAGHVSGGALYKYGIGELSLSGSNAYGDTVLNGGTLLIENKDALGSGKITIELPSILATNVDVTLRDTQVVQINWTDGTIDVRAGTFDIGKIQGGAQLFKIGAGKLVLNDASYDGWTFVHAGTLEIAEGHSLRSDQVSVDAGATFSLKDNAHYAGNVVGSGTFVYAGSDHTVFSGTSSGSVSTIVRSGTFVSYGDGLISGNVLNQGTLALDYNQNRTLAGVISGTGAVLKQGATTVTMTGSNTYSGGTAISGGTLRLDTNTASPIFAVADTAILDLHVAGGQTDYHSATGTTTFLGKGTLRKTGAGVAYWGAVAGVFAMESGSLIDVQEGTLFGGSNANEDWTINESSLYVAAGAGFHGVEANVRVDALNGAGRIESGYTGGYQSFTYGVANGSGSFDGVLADTVGYSGHFVKVGTGTQTFTGSNTYTGGTTLRDGQVHVTNGHGLGTGRVMVDGGTLRVSGSSALVNQVMVASGTYARTISGDLTDAINATSDLGGIDTTAKILAGSSASEATLVSSFSTAEDTNSDVYHLSGMNKTEGYTELFVLELSFANIDPGHMLAWRDEAGDWVNARDGNKDNNSAYALQFNGTFGLFQSIHGENLAAYIGAWGVSVDGGFTSVWTVLNHNSDFAAVPEPSTWVLLLCGALMIGLLRRKRCSKKIEGR